MRLENSISASLASGRSLGFEAANGHATSGFENFWGDTAFPPPGYLPWDVLEVGSGDTYGFYWPLGKDDHPPLVCTLLHDTHTLLPIASTFDRALRLLLAGDVAHPEELKELAKDFGIKLGRTARAEPDEKVPLFALDAAQLLKVDDASPLLLVSAARELRGKDLSRAQQLARLATEILPEYADAWDMLANMGRQMREERAIIENTLRVLTCPMAFGARDRKKVIASLKKLPDTTASNPNDPIWKRRTSITFADPATDPAEITHLTEAVEELHAQKDSLRAIGLRLSLGEWISHQTVSFLERANWSWPKFRQDLHDDHTKAGLQARLAAIAPLQAPPPV
jgi:hypothetical protein